MLDTKYKAINFFNLSSKIIGSFKHNKLEDNSLILLRYKEEKIEEPELKFNYTSYGGDKFYELKIASSRREIDAVVTICKTSANHFVINGFTDKYTKTGYGKTFSEVSAYIERWFINSSSEN